MSDPLKPTDKALLIRLLRSPGPWRVAGLPAADQPGVTDLLGRGLVEVRRGVYEPTPAGRAALVG